jgi:hypothetical protein
LNLTRLVGQDRTAPDSDGQVAENRGLAAAGNGPRQSTRVEGSVCLLHVRQTVPSSMAVARRSFRRSSALENGGESGSCSNVASGPTRAELLAFVAAAIVALDAGETEVARARMQTLDAAVRSQGNARRAKMEFEDRIGSGRRG